MSKHVSVLLLILLLVFSPILVKSWKQCCNDPLNSFLFLEFAGPCACVTFQQKWERYRDWIEINGGYVHPNIEFKHNRVSIVIPDSCIKYCD